MWLGCQITRQKSFTNNYISMKMPTYEEKEIYRENIIIPCFYASNTLKIQRSKVETTKAEKRHPSSLYRLTLLSFC